MFTQRISMDCTQEQYDKFLKEELGKMGYKEKSLSCWLEKNCQFITNCFDGALADIGNIDRRCINRFGRTYLGSFNAPLFLALAAMRDEGDERRNYGEWYITDNGIWIKYGVDAISVRKKYRRKATALEIMAKFGKNQTSLEEKYDELLGQIKSFSVKMEKIYEDMRELYGIEKIREEDMSNFIKGDYVTIETPDDGNLIAIFSCKINKGINIIAGLDIWGRLTISNKFGLNKGDLIRPSTPSEIAILDKKLAEQGKMFDKEKCEIVDAPKYKEPVIGEMAIFWDSDKKQASCRLLTKINGEGLFYDTSGLYWENAILYESPEQYKNLLNEK